MVPSDYRRLATRARTRVADDPVIQREWRGVLAAVGYGPESLWLDRVRLRVVPSRDVDHRRLAPLPPHRDTWASRIMAQVNWWLPLYPLRETSTMLIWPGVFRRPVANNSADWDFEEFKRAGLGYPLLPAADAHPERPGTPVLIEPGDLLGFSAAHLHGGIRDASGRTRFGIDSRTVWEPDRRAGRRAPDVDGSPGTEMWAWFETPEAAGACA